MLGLGSDFSRCSRFKLLPASPPRTKAPARFRREVSFPRYGTLSPLPSECELLRAYVPPQRIPEDREHTRYTHLPGRFHRSLHISFQTCLFLDCSQGFRMEEIR